jgi:Raf kinase inhibitor-like YbhB/YbcL family protein
MNRSILMFVASVFVGLAIANAKQEGPMATLTLSSPTIQPDKPIPAQHSCQGDNISPALQWSGVPAGTKGFALICDDPDAPGGTWIHWVIYGIPATATALPEKIAPTETVSAITGAKQGRNSFDNIGYGGPCPPPGNPHHYHFKLYALDSARYRNQTAARRQQAAVGIGNEKSHPQPM